jgi:DNA-binding XRE family transcriptional regulator
MNFGMWLEQLLKENRLTKTWLAKKAKVSHSMINYWKTRSDPSLLRAYQVVQLIAKETNQDPALLWSEVFLMLEER